MSEKTTNIIAFVLLSITFLIGFFSYQGDSLTMDEKSHISAGYSYLSQQDYRINPEHPPIIKDLAAIPLMFLNLNFPSNDKVWTDGTNNQWALGNKFIFDSGNNAEQIISWARLPMLSVLIFLGWFLFWWIKKEFNNKAALMTLFLFSFSPNLIAHGRLVATDVGAVLGFVLSTYFWLKFLKVPTNKNVIKAGLIFGFSMLLKFSLALLIPFLGTITIVYIFLYKKDLKEYLWKSVIIGLIGLFFVILPVYLFHMKNYPAARQAVDTAKMLKPTLLNPLREALIYTSHIPVIRAIGYYFTGLLMATQRTAFGNNTYFLGKISNSSFRGYFPLVYLLKVPIAFHLLTLTAILIALFKKKTKTIIDKIKSNFTEFSMLVFMFIYWTVSISGNLNLGIRHLLPVLPFTYILVSLYLVKFIEKENNKLVKKISIYFVIASLGFYATSTLMNYPYYISYFNEFVGIDNGYKYVVDSNYDWGQDLKRLVKWTEDNNIKKIKIDYFGGANVKYYLPESEPLNPFQENQKGYMAVSTTYLQAGTGTPIPGFDYNGGYYKWLENYKPIARAGKSILIYYIK